MHSTGTRRVFASRLEVVRIRKEVASRLEVARIRKEVAQAL
jgi:3-polyprenyl-4-hydroxybenzoate decarboxylase